MRQMYIFFRNKNRLRSFLNDKVIIFQCVIIQYVECNFSVYVLCETMHSIKFYTCSDLVTQLIEIYDGRYKMRDATYTIQGISCKILND